jgi:hypothetical protein
LSTVSIIAVIFIFVLIKHTMDTKAKQDRERLRLIEEALRSGNLDDRSREELMGTLTGRRQSAPKPHAPVMARNPNDVGFFMKFTAFIGWISFCIGISFFILCANSHNYEFLMVPATILGCAGFGLVTYPFVIRELNAPHRNPAEQRP